MPLAENPRYLSLYLFRNMFRKLNFLKIKVRKAGILDSDRKIQSPIVKDGRWFSFPLVFFSFVKVS